MLAQIALRLLPDITEGVTRGEYSLLLRKAARAAGATGYEWTEADNEPVIRPTTPGFPRPRKEDQHGDPEDALLDAVLAGPRGDKDPSGPGNKGPKAVTV